MIAVLKEKIDSLQKKLLDVSFPIELEDSVKRFVETKDFDLELYKKICTGLELNYSLSTIIKYISFLNSDIDRDVFGSQIDKCIKHLLNIKSDITSRYNSYLDNKQENEKIIKQIEACEKIQELYDTSSIIDLSQIDLSLCGLSLEEEVELLFYISASNASAIQREYERLLEVPEPVVEEVIDEDLEELLAIAKDIIGENYVEPTNKEEALLLLNDDISFESRDDIYDCISVVFDRDYDYDLKRNIIQLDLKEIIIPKILGKELSIEEAKVVLRSIINIYNNTKSTIEELKNYNPSADEALLKEINSLVETTIQDLYYKGKYNQNVELYTEIENAATALKEELQNQVSRNTKRVRITDSLKNKYYILKSIIEESTKTKERANEPLTDINPISSKNIFIMLDPEYLEEDTDEFKSGLDIKQSVLQLISTYSSKDLTVSNNNRAKTDNYSETFIKKYHVKQLDGGRIDAFYSRFSTTLSEVFPECGKDSNIIIVYAVGPGYADSNTKHNIIENAYARLYKNADRVDYIIDLFNTKWDKVSEDEKNRRIKEISQILENQQEIYKSLKGGELV